MVEMVISLMSDRVIKRMGSKGVASLMTTSIRIIFVVLHEYRIAGCAINTILLREVVATGIANKGFDSVIA